MPFSYRKISGRTLNREVINQVNMDNFMLPISKTNPGHFTGNVTGNVTGNLTGDVTGDLTGAVTGNVTGNVTGDLTGAVTGNVTGNVTGDVAGNLTGNVTGNVDGIVGGTTPAAVTATNLTISSGGPITQSTSKSTAVTLNKYSGQITMDDAPLANNAVVTFTLTNSVITTGSCIFVNHASVGQFGVYEVFADNIISGSCSINVKNNHGGSLSQAIVLNFIVLGITIA